MENTFEGSSAALQNPQSESREESQDRNADLLVSAEDFEELLAAAERVSLRSVRRAEDVYAMQSVAVKEASKSLASPKP